MLETQFVRAKEMNMQVAGKAMLRELEMVVLQEPGGRPGVKDFVLAVEVSKSVTAVSVGRHGEFLRHSVHTRPW